MLQLEPLGLVCGVTEAKPPTGPCRHTPAQRPVAKQSSNEHSRLERIWRRLRRDQHFTVHQLSSLLPSRFREDRMISREPYAGDVPRAPRGSPIGQANHVPRRAPILEPTDDLAPGEPFAIQSGHPGLAALTNDGRDRGGTPIRQLNRRVPVYARLVRANPDHACDTLVDGG